MLMVMDIEDTTGRIIMDVDGTARDKLRMILLPLDQTLTLTLMPMAGDTMEDTTVLIIMDTGMARDKLMKLLPLDQTLTLMPMAGVIMEDTTVLITVDTGMARDKLRMRLLPQDQTLMPMLMLMAGDIEDTTVHTGEVTTGENKIPTKTQRNIFHQTIT